MKTYTIVQPLMSQVIPSWRAFPYLVREWCWSCPSGSSSPIHAIQTSAPAYCLDPHSSLTRHTSRSEPAAQHTRYKRVSIYDGHFPHNAHNRRPIARPWGRAMDLLLWGQIWAILLHSPWLCYEQYSLIVDCIITSVYCTIINAYDTVVLNRRYNINWIQT